MPQTIEVTVDPRGYPKMLLGGEAQELEETYIFWPEGRGGPGLKYQMLFWRSGEVVCVPYAEIQRFWQLAKRKRKPFPLTLETMEPVPGATPICSSALAGSWGAELRDRRNMQRYAEEAGR
jgi:hypothetical protein